MKQMLALGAALILFAVDAVSAQQAPTEIDMRAAYCLGVTAAQVALISENELQKALVGDATLKRQKRFRDYLASRGFKGTDDKKIQTGFNIGLSDVGQCTEFWQRPQNAQCQEKCGNVADDRQQNVCLKNCGTDESCRRVSACLFDFVP